MTTEIQRRPDLAGALLKVKGAGMRTTEAYRCAMRGFQESGLPITVEGFAEYVENLRGKRSAAGVNLVIAAGRKAFQQAGERLGLPMQQLAVIRQVMSEIRRIRMAPPEVKVLAPEERELLFDALPARLLLIAEVLYLTGARVSEILGVRAEAVRVDGQSAELRLYGKGGKERFARIPLALYRRIRGTFEDGDYLFTTGRGNRYSRQYVTREIGRAARRAIGKGSSAHVLRHSRATDLLATTHRIKAVSRLLGHSDEATTLRYYVKDSFTDEELFDGENSNI